MTRQEKVFKAFELLKQGQELLEEAGFKLIFDSYNDNGAYAVPKDVDFPDDFAVETGECKKSFEELTDARIAPPPSRLAVSTMTGSASWTMSRIGGKGGTSSSSPKRQRRTHNAPVHRYPSSR